MPTSFRHYAPEQDLLLPPSLGEWLPEGHLAYFISDVVEELDLVAFYAPYQGDGRRKSPYEPRMMLKMRKKTGSMARISAVMNYPRSYNIAKTG